MTEQHIVGFHHSALRCPDLKASTAFYEALGFRKVHHWSLPAYAIETAIMMQAPDNKSWLELFDLAAEIPMQGSAAKTDHAVLTGALAHICLTVIDLERACDTITAAGATCVSDPQSLALGSPAVNVRNAIFQGPAGEMIELLQTVAFPGDTAAA